MAWPPVDWLAGVTPDAAFLNENIRDMFRSICGDWITYNATLGSSGGGLTADTVGRYRDLGMNKREVEIRSTITAIGNAGVYNWNLPSGPVAPAMAWDPLGTGTVVDVSANLRAGLVAIYSGGSNISMADGNGGRLSNTVPFTVAVGDTYSIKATYEWQ